MQSCRISDERVINPETSNEADSQLIRLEAIVHEEHDKEYGAVKDPAAVASSKLRRRRITSSVGAESVRLVKPESSDAIE